MGRNWSASEDAELAKLVRKYGRQWGVIASHMKDRSPAQVLARWEKCLDPVIVKGPFTEAEDELIREYVKENGPQNWPRITSFLPNRSPKQCRERWFNHLDPSVVKHAWTPEEDETIFKNYQRLGPKWSIIAKMIPGRTDNAIKNRFNSSISKRISVNSTTHKEILLPDHSKKRKQVALVQHKAADEKKGDEIDVPSLELPQNSDNQQIEGNKEGEKSKNAKCIEIPHFDPFSIPSPLFHQLDNSRLASPAPPIPGFSSTPGAFGGLISPSALATAPLASFGELSFS